MANTSYQNKKEVSREEVLSASKIVNINIKETRQLTVSEVLKEFGESISYDELIKSLSSFSEKEQKEIKKGISKKQQEFWNNKEIIKYYTQIHPRTPFVKEHYEKVKEEVSPQNGEIIVELGVGVGNLMNRILKESKNFKFIGIDYSKESLDKILENLSEEDKKKVELIDHDLKNGIPLPSCSVDKIISNWTTSHFGKEDLKKSFEEAKRVLKPHGKIIFASLLKGGLYLQFTSFGRFKKLIWALIQNPIFTIRALFFERKCKKYFPEYSTDDLLNLIQETGFQILKKKYTIGDDKGGKSIIIIAEK